MSEASLYRPPRFIAGLDIGQLADPSALCVVERQMRVWQGRLEPYYLLGHLERIPLQTPYPVMARGVRERLERLGERCCLVIDATGVGRVIVDDFRASWMLYDPETQMRRQRANSPSIVALTLTGGDQPRAVSWDEQHVPRLDVLMRWMLCLQQQRFQAAESLTVLPTLIREAQQYRLRYTERGDADLYSTWKDEKHDDLLFAVCVAVWYGDKYAPVSLPGDGTARHAVGASNPLLRPRGRAVGTGRR